MKKASVLITGARGFVGPVLMKEFRQQGIDVIGLDRQEADIRDLGAISHILNKAKPSRIIHLAGISAPSYAKMHEKETLEVNVHGTQNLLEASLKLDVKPKILIVSSAHVYGLPHYLPIDENHPLAPKDVYARSRMEQEQIVQKYRDRLPLIVARSFNHTGPGQSDQFIVPKIIKQIVEIKKGKRNRLEIGNIKVARDILDVRDVVKAYRLLLDQPKMGIIVNVCRGESIRLMEVIEKGKDRANLLELEVVTDKQYIRSKDAQEIYGDPAYLKSLIPWEIEWSYDRMIADLYDYWESVI